MNGFKIAGFSLILILWLWLCQGVVRAPGGFTLHKLLIIVFSAILIFVPLYKKYIRTGDSNRNQP